MLSEAESLSRIQATFSHFPSLVIMLGSGWNRVLEAVTIEQEASYQELFDVEPSVPGHDGRLVVGTVQGMPCAFLAGRFHMYEGFSAHEATLPIRLLAQLGVQKLVVTSASGALNPKYRVGDFVVLSDLLTLLLSLDNPLRGPEFIDTSDLFSPDLRQISRTFLTQNEYPWHEGVYAYYHGPNYETPTDKMALRQLGADVVGMSTVPETLAARSLGLEVLGLSFVTNLAFVKHDHQEVVRQAQAASEKMSSLLKEIIRYDSTSE